ncbi:MAG: EF-hand domain-containing protein [Candidatus Sericytochromatia bacterium]|nr:EF-hand domain-containing protein [Candidatus Sericytochromatia bacterium]
MHRWLTGLLIGGLAAGCIQSPTSRPVTIQQVPGQAGQGLQPATSAAVAGPMGRVADGGTWTPGGIEWSVGRWSGTPWSSRRWPQGWPGGRPRGEQPPYGGQPPYGWQPPYGGYAPGGPGGPSQGPGHIDPGIRAEFQSLDTNRDGYLTQAEYIEGKMAQIRYIIAPTEEQLAQQRASIAADFATSDRNRNGVVTLYEYANAPIYHIL